MGNFEALCNEYRENKRLIEELEDYNDSIKAQIIELMGDNDTMIQGAAKATYKIVVSDRFDSKRFKEQQADLYKAYCSEMRVKRFTVVQYSSIIKIKTLRRIKVMIVNIIWAVICVIVFCIFLLDELLKRNK